MLVTGPCELLINMDYYGFNLFNKIRMSESVTFLQFWSDFDGVQCIDHEEIRMGALCKSNQYIHIKSLIISIT